MKHCLLILVCLIVLVLPLTAPKHAGAQCQVRSDWNIYTVARGDTLSMIARRFTTTTPILAQANCLANANLIYTGQQLRVPYRDPQPPIYNDAPEYPPYTMQIESSYQQFDNGFMTWRADNGSIWVFIQQGADSGYVMRFAASEYGSLPNTAPYPQVPAGRTVPTFGFKRIYDNFPSIRAALGWGIGSERGFTMITQPAGIAFTLTVPDQRIVQVNPNRTWQIMTASPQPYATGATFQPFQSGFMVWRADTGEIRTFFGVGTGEIAVYPAATYGGLPALPAFTPFSPNSGFAKVWIYLAGVRDRLGWPTSGEQGYTMTLSSGNTSFTLPDGSTVQQINGSQWSVTSPSGRQSTLFSGAPIEAIVPQEADPEATSTRSETSMQVITFDANPKSAMPGDTITVNWDVQGAQTVNIVAGYEDYRVNLNYTAEEQPAQGSITIPMPTDPEVFNSDVTIWLTQDDGTQVASIPIHLGCPYGLFWDSSQCGYEPAQELPAIYQPFERGFMLNVHDSVFTVIFDEAHTGTIFAETQQVELSTAPEGLYAPDAVFVAEWTRTSQYQQLLGWATGPAQSYTATAQLRHYSVRGDPERTSYVTLPDGRIIEFTGGGWGNAARWDWIEP